MTRQTTEVETRDRKNLRAFARWTPALLLIAATAWLYASGMATDISLDNLQAHEIALRAEVATHPLLALAVFTALYAVATAAFRGRREQAGEASASETSRGRFMPGQCGSTSMAQR